jgi:hypothetical protein
MCYSAASEVVERCFAAAMLALARRVMDNFLFADNPRTIPFDGHTRVCEDSSRLVCEKTSARYYSHRAFTTCAVSPLGKLKSSTSALTRSF